MQIYSAFDDPSFPLSASVILPDGRSLFEYLCELPMEELEVYPQKGYHEWMGPACRTMYAQILARSIWQRRNQAQRLRDEYPREYLERLSRRELRDFLAEQLEKQPIWLYADPIKDALNILYGEDERGL